MLARAARRKLRSEQARACEQLTLPWLCPAALRRRTTLTPTATLTSPTTPTPRTCAARRPQRCATSPRRDARALATTADLQPESSQSPFHGLMQAWSSRATSPEMTRLESWDASNPLILRDSLSVPIVTSKRVAIPIGSNAIEMYQNLYACLRVGRIDRANTILARLTDMLEPSAPELIDAHNIYFQTLFDLAQQDPSKDSMSKLEGWFVHNFEDKGIKPSAATFVVLLRAAMNFLHGSAQEAAILKYMALASEHGEDMADEVNHSPDFTDEEWNTLIRAQPEEFKDPPSVEEVQNMLVNAPEARRGLVEAGLQPYLSQKITIKPVPQKGFGLDSLKQALSVFDDGKEIPYPHEMEGTREERDRAHAYARQLRMEQDGYEAAVDRWRREDEHLQRMGHFGVLKTKSVQAIMYNWYIALVPLFKDHIKRAQEIMAAPAPDNHKDPAQIYGPWLERCKPERLAAITISRALSATINYERNAQIATAKISSLASSIGSDIMDYLNSDAQLRLDAFLKKQRQQVRKELLDQLQIPNPKGDPAEDGDAFAHSYKSLSLTEKTRIPIDVRTQLGALCLELLMQTATITVTAIDPKTGEELTSSQAAFQHIKGFSKGKKIGFMSPNHHFTAKLRNESVQNIQPVTLPMLIEPKPWSSFQDGGYYTLPQRVVRQKSGDPAQRAYAESAIENGDMTKVLAGLDVLGRVPWQINAPILEIMAQVWNNGEGIGGLVPEETPFQRPEEPPADAPYHDRVRWAKQVQEYENLKGGKHSQRCFQNFQLETARAFAGEKRIFFPHSVDFRGRAYPLPPVLNHIGSDVSRGLLKFANGKELGTVGLQWLKIHLANLYGYDKASLKEREQFAMDNLNEIYDSATNPLDGRRWWLQAEDPWQCLACCMELKNALDSPDPTRFVSQLPVHQDGTCNGLQHYAALGGDHAGARQVNLEPSDRPQDIYTGVAELVKGMVSADAEKGVATAQFINGRITRKVVKRTVMTNVYGVTFIGAKMQVEDELRSLFPNFKPTDKVRSLAAVALYIAFKIFEALGQIFNGAQEIQYWLGECGDRITTSLSAEQVERIAKRAEGLPVTYDPEYKSPEKITKTEQAKINKVIETFKTSIIWTTPLKMPVVQPYRKDSTTKIRTKLQDITVVKRSANDVIDKRKQLQAFPPNFIHSLDATHMTLSALKCHELGLDFAAVHDSFWTHASDIPNLNVILRDAFVRMHSDDIIGRLAEEFKARYAGAMHMAYVHTFSTAGVKIREWRVKYYRSTGRTSTKILAIQKARLAPTEEIALEYKRQQLLKSKDPEEVKQGQEMVTPTSIWLEHQDPKAMNSPRLNLIGETKKEKSKRFDEMRDKVLDREADLIAKDKSEDNRDVSSKIDAEVEAEAEAAVEAEAEAEAEVEVEAEAEAETEAEAEAEAEAGYTKPKGKAATKDSEKCSVPVWIPLSFPPPPAKGGWEVSRLLESKYFFS